MAMVSSTIEINYRYHGSAEKQTMDLSVPGFDDWFEPQIKRNKLL